MKSAPDEFPLFSNRYKSLTWIRPFEDHRFRELGHTFLYQINYSDKVLILNGPRRLLVVGVVVVVVVVVVDDGTNVFEFTQDGDVAPPSDIVEMLIDHQEEEMRVDGDGYAVTTFLNAEYPRLKTGWKVNVDEAAIFNGGSVAYATSDTEGSHKHGRQSHPGASDTL